jgi:hypothetical protein
MIVFMISPTHNLTPQNQTRRPRDTFLLLLWVFGYHLLIRLFGGLQRIEQQFAGSKPTSSGKV